MPLRFGVGRIRAIYDRPIQKSKMEDSIFTIEKQTMRVTTTSTTYVEFDDNCLSFSYPLTIHDQTRIYASARVVGVDLGVQLETAGGPGAGIRETREWTGTNRTQFFYHDITEDVFVAQHVDVKLLIRTTAAEGILSRGARIMVIVDRGWW